MTRTFNSSMVKRYISNLRVMTSGSKSRSRWTISMRPSIMGSQKSKWTKMPRLRISKRYCKGSHMISGFGHSKGHNSCMWSKALSWKPSNKIYYRTLKWFLLTLSKNKSQIVKSKVRVNQTSIKTHLHLQMRVVLTRRWLTLTQLEIHIKLLWEKFSTTRIWSLWK